jgi:glycosyltransferase involved in cell wall biosynthesis
MPNVLFILYHDFTSNSAYHVHSFANCLTDLGWNCAVTVPNHRQTIRTIGTKAQYTYSEFSDLERSGPRFPDGRGADIVHCWTPREIVRSFYERVRELHRAQLVIHLEDNERQIAARSLKRSYDGLKKLRTQDLDRLIEPNISHPILSEQFLEKSAGVTVIMRTLKELVPAGKPTIEVWPSADEELFGPRAIDWERRQRMGVPRNSTAIVYTGNVHAANAAEVRSLYLAIAILNREGHPATLIRTGRDFCEFLGSDDKWARKHSIELDFVERTELPAILSMANVFVQPGRPGPFNDYRFPSKIPEFCATGRPVILPASNIGLTMRHLEDAYVVPEATGVAIATAVRTIREDPRLEQRLAAGARRFFTEELSWRRSAGKLQDFYRQLLKIDVPEVIPHSLRNGMTEPFAEAPLVGPSPAPMVRNSKF